MVADSRCHFLLAIEKAYTVLAENAMHRYHFYLSGEWAPAPPLNLKALPQGIGQFQLDKTVLFFELRNFKLL